jgi:cysteine synthase
MKDPSLIPDSIKEKLSSLGLWDVTPENLFRITWKNEPTPEGGGYGGVNYLELPSSLTGVDARIIALVGKWMPTGSHKVGATFGCLVPRLVTGQFDPVKDKAVWPSTGNYCRGGAYDASLLACESIAILPEGMSRERFEWLEKVAGEVIATPGSESNVKEIFDKTWELRETRDDVVIFNQFDEFGNYLWHYDITGHAMEDVLKKELRPNDNYAGVVLTTGSAGTIACKHVPWIHNVKNTDMIISLDDNVIVNLARLFNEPAGHKYLVEKGVPEAFIENLELLGFSSIANLAMAIKFAKYYELGENDIVLTVFTDSMELYQSRLKEMHEEHGEYQEVEAAAHFARDLHGLKTDHMLETRYTDRRRIHNLKYYTWVEQQGRTYEEIMAQWNDRDYWTSIQALLPDIDQLIVEFNERVGLI